MSDPLADACPSVDEAVRLLQDRAARESREAPSLRRKKALELEAHLRAGSHGGGFVPSGPRKRGEGCDDEDQGIVSAAMTADGGAQLRITLLAAGFIIGPCGSSVRDISRQTGAEIRSWNESHCVQGRSRKVRTVVIEGPRDAVVAALETTTMAVDRYKELCEGKFCGQVVDRSQTINGVTFTYQPPPRSVVPYAAALRSHDARSPSFGRKSTEGGYKPTTEGLEKENAAKSGNAPTLSARDFRDGPREYSEPAQRLGLEGPGPQQVSLLRMDSFPPLAASPLASASPFLQCPATPLPPGAAAMHLLASRATPPPGFHTPLAPRSLRYAGSGGQVADDMQSQGQHMPLLDYGRVGSQGLELAMAMDTLRAAPSYNLFGPSPLSFSFGHVDPFSPPVVQEPVADAPSVHGLDLRAFFMPEAARPYTEEESFAACGIPSLTSFAAKSPFYDPQLFASPEAAADAHMGDCQVAAASHMDHDGFAGADGQDSSWEPMLASLGV